ncbi:MAG: VWA domain-containing protein [Pyrinomonadaceae bacterium]
MRRSSFVSNIIRDAIAFRSLRALSACVLFLLLAMAAGGQQRAPAAAAVAVTQQPETERSSASESPLSDDDEVIKVSTSEVLLPVTVRDEAGRLVTTLERKDFRVWENGREQPLSDLRLRRVPVDVVLLVDASSSVAGNLEDFRRAVDEFAARLAPEDRVSLLSFSDRVELLQDWTTSRVQLRRALRRVSPGMFTRFNDALYLAAREQSKDARRRQALVVLSDGIDSGRGHATLQMSLGALLEAGASVYVISNTEIERARKRAELDTLQSAPLSSRRFSELRIGDLRESLSVLDQSERNLAELTNMTGGRLFKPQSFAALDSVYAEVAEELRHQYALYYMPLDKTRDGKFRRVQIKTSNSALRINARVGYFAPRS